MRVAGLIPARAGSKGVPGKNRRLFRGRPLWRLAADIADVTCDDFRVSTDDERILDECRDPYGLERPTELAQDDTPMLDVVKHFGRVVQCDLIVLLQPTQPLREVKHVRAALDLMRRRRADSVVSVCEIPAHMSPGWALRVGGIGQELYGPERMPLDSLPSRRQDLGPTYYRDGTVYILRPEVVAAGSLYGSFAAPLVIPRSESCSIDTEEDWQRAEDLA